ncbi:hypothetical protein B0H14DRAFT_2632819 [Mycena olivaceomarginata]|nr:hypothetical protein B0H14DRAFT_2632819 [Mycena olivaceomarginata]
MPELPLELERQILELAFTPNSRDIALKVTLCLVARRVQVWIDRIFYELVTIRDEDRGKRFLSLIQSNAKPPGFFAVVKTLCLTYSVNGATACGILAACNRVESLACWVDTDAPQLPLLISQLPLHRLSTRMDHFLRIPFGAPPSSYLSSLTHIELRRWDSSHLSQLAHLPHLTHKRRMALGRVKESLPPSAKIDHRIVVQDLFWGIVEDWEGLYLGRSDMWSRAEAAVAQRKNSVGQK